MRCEERTVGLHAASGAYASVTEGFVWWAHKSPAPGCATGDSLTRAVYHVSKLAYV